MWFPLLLQCYWWLVSSKKSAMVEYELSLGWLDEATLFPAEPNDYGLNFNEILSNGKANDEADLVTGLPDLDWLDAQTDLSALDESKGLNLLPFEIEDPLNLDDAANLLLDLIDSSNLDASYLSSDISKADLNDILNSSTPIEQEVATFDVPDLPMSSPFHESTSGAGSPASSMVEACLSPSSYAYDPIEAYRSPDSTAWNSVDACQSPGSSSSIDDGGYESISEAFTPGSVGDVTVTVCDTDVTDTPAEALSIDEVSRSVRKRKYVRGDLEEIPKVKVILKEGSFHPYAKAVPSKRPSGKKERKKIQNKEAAARYRVKKRMEEGQLSEEVEGLEKEQEGLRKKHDDLLSEIKYLKKLMVEVLQKKGIM